MQKTALILLLSICLLAGCTAKEAYAPQDGAPGQAADSGVPGFYALDQGVSGGTAQGGALNTILVSRQQEELLIDLRFADRAPEFSVEGFENPSRLLLRLPGVSPAFAGEHHDALGMFQGLFHEERGGELHVYLQFSGNIAYKAKESETGLLLTVRADDQPAGSGYFVRMPYTNDTIDIAEKNGLTPALCDDLSSMIYISAAHATLAEADFLRLTLETELKNADVDATSLVLPMDFCVNPPYVAPVSRYDLDMLGAIELESGEKQDADIFALDARFLCWNPGGEKAVMSRPMDTPDDDGLTYEEVWLYATDGSRERMFGGEFSALQKAQFSKDGQHLAFIEQLSGMRLLYVYDCSIGELTLLSTQGFGDYTADFAWADDGKLYAMTGDDVMQLMAFDPAIAGDERVYGVEEREGSFGSLGCAGEYVFFSDEYGNIQRVHTPSASRVLFVSGDGFLTSPNGKYMALIGYEEAGEDALMTSLSILPLAEASQAVDEEEGADDLPEGEEDGTNAELEALKVRVSSTETLGSMCWSQDGETLYYLVNMPGDSDYPVALHSYSMQTGENKLLGRLTSNTIQPSNKPGELVLMAYYTKDRAFIPVTFRLTLP